MFSWMKRRAPVVQETAVEPRADSADKAALQTAVRSIARQASSVGREAAEVRGVLDDTTKAAQRSAEAVASLEGEVKQITQAQQAIHAVTQDSLGQVERARGAVEAVGHEVAAIVQTLQQVASAAHGITGIALQTRLVAFNASVEAKRAGEAGRGFGVVADAVRDLAGQVESSSKAIMSTIGDLNTRIEALSAEIHVRDGRDGDGAVHQALAAVRGGVGRITEAAAQSRRICDGLNGRMSGMRVEIEQTGHALDAAMQRSAAFLSVSEELIEVVANCGIETEDTPYIDAAMQAAGEIAALLEQALRAGGTTIDDLFDEAYRPIAGTQPAQHTARFTALADRLFPEVQERMLGLSDKMVFCIAVDRNGYVPTHNRVYCQPQRADVVWNTANSRYRRIFNDRTGLASARNTRPFLLQTYRRDMGGGRFVVMKEAAAPITVQGRHWGGIRLAFKF